MSKLELYYIEPGLFLARRGNEAEQWPRSRVSTFLEHRGYSVQDAEALVRQAEVLSELTIPYPAPERE